MKKEKTLSYSEANKKILNILEKFQWNVSKNIVFPYAEKNGRYIYFKHRSIYFCLFKSFKKSKKITGYDQRYICAYNDEKSISILMEDILINEIRSSR